MDQFNVVVLDPVKAMAVKIWSYVPAIVGALVILIVGWLVAKLIEAVVARVMKAVKLDMASDKAGISNVLAQGDIKLSLSELIGAIVYWLVILVVVATALDALNLKIASELISRLVGYVPNILGAIFILVLGSFLNVVIHRVPRGLSVVKPRSACPACGSPIGWYGNIPVLSWLLLRRRCRHCRSAISIQYPLVELGTGLIWAGMAWRHGWSRTCTRTVST